MAVLDHWHPVYPADDLGSRPVAIKLAGQQIALYRTASGKIGALDDICPHRRMKLSLGEVIGEKLQCKYHGWTFDCDGQGESPGTPKLHACAAHFEVHEQEGYIWVRRAGSRTAFPEFHNDGFTWMCNVEHVAHAPLEVTVDNFCEIEHTPTTHAIFGYQLERMKDVTVQFEPTDTTVKVINCGPPKNLGFFLNTVIGIGRDYLFNDVWTTHFSPVYSVYDHWWSDPKSGAESKVRWRLYQFFTPVDEHSTRVTSFSYARSDWRFLWPAGGLLPFRGVMRKNLDHEIGLDVKILGSLASYDTSIEGMKLSRFDKVLGLNRERIQRLYRGEAQGPTISLRLAE